MNHLPRTNHKEKNSHNIQHYYDVLNSLWITKQFLLWCEIMEAKMKKKKLRKNNKFKIKKKNKNIN
jgi:hypothetical protein